MRENKFIPPRMDAAPGGGGAGAHAGGGNPFRNLNRRVLPQGMDRQDRQGPNGELVFVQADPTTVTRTIDAFEGHPSAPTPPAGEEYFEEGVGTDRFLQVMAEPGVVSDIRDRFRRQVPDPDNYTGLKRWLLERRLVKNAILQEQRSRTARDVAGVAVLTGLLTLGVVLVGAAIVDAQNAPQVTRINLPPLTCYNAPEGSVAMGYNLSINGEVLGSSPNIGTVVLIQPDQNPLTETRKVCSGDQPAAIDIVHGDGSVLLSTFANDQLSLMQNGCVGNKGCASVIPLRR